MHTLIYNTLCLQILGMNFPHSLEYIYIITSIPKEVQEIKGKLWIHHFHYHRCETFRITVIKRNLAMFKGNKLTEPQEYIGLKTKYILLITALGKKRKTCKIIWKVEKRYTVLLSAFM